VNVGLVTGPATPRPWAKPCANAVFPAGNLTAVPLDVSIDLLPQALFIRGDSNQDGTVDLTDAVSTFGALFLGGAGPACPSAADSNDDGSLGIRNVRLDIFPIDWLALSTKATYYAFTA